MNTDHGPIEECNFLFSCNENSMMTTDQKTLVHLYTMACSVTFFIIIVWFLERTVWVYFRRYSYGVEDSVEAAETNLRFSEMNGIEAFIPVVRRYELTDPIICVNVSNIPSEYLPIPEGQYFGSGAEDPQAYSVAKIEEFPLGTQESDMKVIKLIIDNYYVNFT